MIDNGNIKLHRRRGVTPAAPVSNTVEERRQLLRDGNGVDWQLKERAREVWMTWSDVRKRADRAMNFIYRDQWADKITVNGVTMTWREYLNKTGNIAFQSNLLKKKLNTTVGRVLREEYEPSISARDKQEQQYAEIVNKAVDANLDKDEFFSVFIQIVKDATAVGIGIGHENYEMLDGVEDSRTEYVDHSYFFTDAGMTDPRLRDMSLIGQFVDMAAPDVISRFSHSDEDLEVLKEIYPAQLDPLRRQDFFTAEERHIPGYVNFDTPLDRSRCRVYEIWTKECRKRHHIYDYNTGDDYYVEDDEKTRLQQLRTLDKQYKQMGEERGWSPAETPRIDDEVFYDTFWYGHILAQDGTVLWEGESPFGDRSHPFILLAPSYTGGIIQSYMWDGIDHQFLVNRQLVMEDWLKRAQAKGVTFMPRSLVKGHEKEIKAQWASMDDLIFINDPDGTNPDLKPYTVNGAAHHYETAQLISLFKNLLDDSVTSGGAISGDTPSAGTSAALYAQQTDNSATPMLEFIKNTRNFVKEIAKKKAKNILKFYSLDRLASIAGDVDSIIGNPNINLNAIADIEYDFGVMENPNTPTRKLIKMQHFDNLLQIGAISSDEYFTYSGVDEGEEIMRGREARQAEMQAAGIQPEQQPVPVA